MGIYLPILSTLRACSHTKSSVLQHPASAGVSSGTWWTKFCKMLIWRFPKMMVPNNHVFFLLKMTILGCFGGTTILGNTHMEISIPSQWNWFCPFIPWTYPRVFHSFPAVFERFKVMFHFFAPSAIHSPVLIETDKLYHPQKMPFPLKGNNHLEKTAKLKTVSFALVKPELHGFEGETVQTGEFWSSRKLRYLVGGWTNPSEKYESNWINFPK